MVLVANGTGENRTEESIVVGSKGKDPLLSSFLAFHCYCAFDATWEVVGAPYGALAPRVARTANELPKSLGDRPASVVALRAPSSSTSRVPFIVGSGTAHTVLLASAHCPLLHWGRLEVVVRAPSAPVSFSSAWSSGEWCYKVAARHLRPRVARASSSTHRIVLNSPR